VTTTDSPRILGKASRRILHSLPVGVSIANTEGRIVFSNAAADRILGVEASDGSPEEWSEFYGVCLPEDRTSPFPTDQYPLVRALRGEATRDVEMWIRNPHLPDGALISATGSPLNLEDDGIAGAAVVFRDITALRMAQEELRHTNAILKETERQKDELAAFVVHDLKSPITSIMLSSELLIEDLELSAEDAQALRDIHDSAENLHRMVLDLLDIRRAEDGQLRPELARLDLKPLLLAAVHSLRGRAAGSGATLTLEVVDELTVSADPELLHRIVQNLADNCLKYAPGGNIRIAARGTTATSLLITVEDDGPGVPAELHDRIFRLWTSTERDQSGRHRDSRGIGLYFTRLAVEAHGGRIRVEDSDLGGARFCVEFPRASGDT